MPSPASALLLILSTAAWTAVLLAALIPLLRRAGLERTNYAGAKVVTAGGVVLPLAALPGILILIRNGGEPAAFVARMAVVLCGFALLGFFDDRWGSPAARGLKGHLRALIADHRITTGLLKAVGGLSITGWLAWTEPGVPFAQRLVLWLSVALGANAANLLDLRPGRAGAVALLALAAAMAGLAVSGQRFAALAVACLAASEAVVQYRDARGWLMLGDTGSNALGACAAYAVWYAFPGGSVRAAILLVLIGLHVVAERWSLSQIIERSTVIRWLDGLTGRR